MTTFDFSPLFRTAIGFDRLANQLNTAVGNDSGGYPPYNIEAREENAYRITMAVAGFDESELEIVSEQNVLRVSGKQTAGDDTERDYLYRGIANRAFERRFQLAEHVKVDGARLQNGLLHIDLVREVPEAMKPRQIEIRSNSDSRLIESESKQSSDHVKAA